MYWVYILRSNIGRHYIGYTNNLQKRLIRHQKGQSYWTSRFDGWHIIYYEIFNSKSEAIIREKELKSGKGRDELKRKNII